MTQLKELIKNLSTTNPAVKLGLLIILVFPYILIWCKGINLFEQNGFIVSYILILILMGLNSLTSCIVKIPGFIIETKNTGASLETSVNLQEKSFSLHLHGSSDENKFIKIFTYILENIK